MSLFINAMAFISLSVVMALKYEKKLVETQALVFSLVILCLFGLAFFNKMWWIDYICAGVIFLCVMWFLRKAATVSAGMVRNLFLEPSWLISILVILIGGAALSGRGVQGWDELHFWAGDIKSIYILEGYAAKGFYFSTGYGDYPPAYQLVAAWILHLFKRYDEGLMMSGYFLAMQIYLAILLKKIPGKTVICIGAFAWLFFIFSFGPNILYDRGPDVLMGIIYGAALIAIFDVDRENVNYYYFRIALLLSVLVLVKSIGIQWVIFAVVFLVCVYMLEKPGGGQKHMIWCCLAPVSVYFVWQIFCRLRERSTYLVENMALSFRGDKNEMIAEHGGRLASTFVKALFSPMQYSVCGIGVSVAVCFTAYIVAVLRYRRRGILTSKQSKIILGFVITGGILEYTILLFSTVTMFIDEFASYEIRENMVLLIKRYGAPYIIGTLMLLLAILFDNLNGRNSKLIWGMVILVNILISPIQTQWKYIFSYRTDSEYVERDIHEQFPELEKAFELIDMTNANYNQKLAIVMELPENIPVLIAEVWLDYYAAPVPLRIDIVEDIDSWDASTYMQGGKCTAFGVVDDEERYLENGIETNKLYFVP